MTADEEFPVVDETLRLYRMPWLNFVVVRDGHRASVTALHDLVAVGSVRWLISAAVDVSATTHVEVRPEFRARGIAAALLEVATLYADAHGWLTPQSRRTTEQVSV